MPSRKLLFLLLAFAALAISSCKNDEECNPREDGRYLKSQSYWGLEPGEYIPDSIAFADSLFYVAEYVYNEKRQLVQMNETGYRADTMVTNYNVTYTYDDCGRVTSENIFAGLFIDTYIYDAGDRCVRINHEEQGISVNYDSVVYDGNKITMLSCHRGQYTGIYREFEIDAQTQNVTVERHSIGSNVGEHHYTYDDKINPFKKLELPLGVNFAHEHSTNNLVHAVYETNTADYYYTYDTEGYPLARNGMTYEYEDF